MPGPEKLLLLHGFTGAPESWDAVRCQLELPLEVIAPNWTHHFDPEQIDPATGTPQDFDAELDQLLEPLGHSPPGSVFVAGYSLGARLALGLLLRRTELFQGALLLGVHPGLPSAQERTQRLASDAAWIELLTYRGSEAFAQVWQAQPLFKSQAGLPAQVLAQQAKIRRSHSTEALIQALRVLGLGAMPCYWDSLETLGLPVQLLVGAADHRFRHIAERMQQLLPRSQLIVAEGAGHNLLLEAPALVAQCLTKGIADE